MRLRGARYLSLLVGALLAVGCQEAGNEVDLDAVDGEGSPLHVESGQSEVDSGDASEVDGAGEQVAAEDAAGLASIEVSQVGVGLEHLCVVHVEAHVSCLFGRVDAGQGGSVFGEPLAVPSSEGTRQVTAGYGHTCARHESGTVSCWGDNAFGQVGQGASRATPVGQPSAVSSVGSAVDVAAGTFHTCAAQEDGAVHCWGRIPSIRQDGGEHVVEGLDGVISLGSGHEYACGVHEDGSVSCWGWDPPRRDAGLSVVELAAPHRIDGVESVTAIDAGRNHVCVVAEAGNVYCWGSNESQQLGLLSDAPVEQPHIVEGISGAIDVTVGTMHTCALDSTGTTYCWGDRRLIDGASGDTADPLRVETIPDAVAISAGPGFTCAVNGDGVADCWGQVPRPSETRVEQDGGWFTYEGDEYTVSWTDCRQDAGHDMIGGGSEDWTILVAFFEGEASAVSFFRPGTGLTHSDYRRTAQVDDVQGTPEVGTAGQVVFGRSLLEFDISC